MRKVLRSLPRFFLLSVVNEPLKNSGFRFLVASPLLPYSSRRDAGMPFVVAIPFTQAKALWKFASALIARLGRRL